MVMIGDSPYVSYRLNSSDFFQTCIVSETDFIDREFKSFLRFSLTDIKSLLWRNALFGNLIAFQYLIKNLILDSII